MRRMGEGHRQAIRASAVRVNGAGGAPPPPGEGVFIGLDTHANRL